jgi:hypothetical protein
MLWYRYITSLRHDDMIHSMSRFLITRVLLYGVDAQDNVLLERSLARFFA